MQEFLGWMSWISERSQNPARTSFSMVIELFDFSAPIIFSTYFAITSTSKFTGSPALSDRRLVTFAVWGIIATPHICAVDGRNRQADAFNSQRTFGDDVAREFGRNIDLQHVVFAVADLFK